MKNAMTNTMCTTLLAAACAAGCATDDMPLDGIDEDVELSESEHDIHSGGTRAYEWQWRRAVALTGDGTRDSRYCTGTLIGPRHVLTAAHCMPRVGQLALFYTSGTLPDEHSDRTIDAVYLPSGVNPAVDDLTDSSGKFADMAVVRLSANAPSTSIVATLAWTYPGGGDDWGSKVGAGNHEGNTSLGAELRQIGDYTYSDHDRDGHFLTENEQANPGDSGGPFYHGVKVLGVLYGFVFEWEWRNKYASAPHRLDWILASMRYVWSGGAELYYRRLTGTVLSSFVGTKRECQYSCERTGSCRGYTYRLSVCSQMSSVSGSVADSYAFSAMK